MNSSHEIIKIDYGSNFRMIHGDVFNYTKEYIRDKKLSFQDIGLWLCLCEYMKPYSTEINISISKLADDFNKSKGHISERINKLIQYELIIKKDNKLYINLKFITRGNEIYKYIYDMSEADFETKDYISREKAKESDITNIQI